MEKYTVDVKETSSPKILKFELNQFITDHESYEFENIDDAKDSPLAQQLFYLPFVKKVFISMNFIAVERFDIVDWPDVQEEVSKQIENYLNEGGKVIINKDKKKIPVTIYAESTPNPNVLKFVSNKKLVESSYEFISIDDSANSPLAYELFQFPFVKSVFIDYNYVSITKYDIAEWNDITMELREFLKKFIENGNKIITDNSKERKKNFNENEIDINDMDDVSKEIVAILDEYVKPAVASDGGNIVFKSYDSKTKIVKVILQGACSGCPSSTLTLKNGIENMLKQMLHDKVSQVEAING